MGLKDAHDILSYYMSLRQAEQYKHYDYKKQQVIDALEFAVDRLNKEIVYYRNY